MKVREWFSRRAVLLHLLYENNKPLLSRRIPAGCFWTSCSNTRKESILLREDESNTIARNLESRNCWCLRMTHFLKGVIFYFRPLSNASLLMHVCKYLHVRCKYLQKFVRYFYSLIIMRWHIIFSSKVLAIAINILHLSTTVWFRADKNDLSFEVIHSSTHFCTSSAFRNRVSNRLCCINLNRWKSDRPMSGEYDGCGRTSESIITRTMFF